MKARGQHLETAMVALVLAVLLVCLLEIAHWMSAPISYGVAVLIVIVAVGRLFVLWKRRK